MTSKPKIFLHGTTKDFSGFEPLPRKGRGHGVIYFSEATKGKKTKAEHIADGPFGGKLVKVQINESILRRFDPRNDPKAAAIMKGFGLKPNFMTNAGEHVFTDFVEYPDMADIAPRAIADGYDLFRVHEPSVQGFSYAVANNKAIKIIGVCPRRKKGLIP